MVRFRELLILDLRALGAHINPVGLTQIRLRFSLQDDGNGIANYLSLYSGEANMASRPALEIEYYVP